MSWNKNRGSSGDRPVDQPVARPFVNGPPAVGGNTARAGQGINFTDANQRSNDRWNNSGNGTDRWNNSGNDRWSNDSNDRWSSDANHNHPNFNNNRNDNYFNRDQRFGRDGSSRDNISGGNLGMNNAQTPPYYGQQQSHPQQQQQQQQYNSRSMRMDNTVPPGFPNGPGGSNSPRQYPNQDRNFSTQADCYSSNAGNSRNFDFGPSSSGNTDGRNFGFGNRTSPGSSYKQRDMGNTNQTRKGIREGERLAQTSNPRLNRPRNFQKQSKIDKLNAVMNKKKNNGGSRELILFDKKEFTSLIIHLKESIEYHLVHGGDNNKPLSARSLLNPNQMNPNALAMAMNTPVIFSISNLIEKISLLSLPHKQPPWNKEVSSTILVFCILPAEWLEPTDYANISRFITRASTEKQLALKSQELVGIYKLLYGFVKRHLESYGDTIESADFENDTKASTDLDEDATMEIIKKQGAIHEVMRAIAQILLIPNSAMARQWKY
jgi:hypothetical protein